MSRGGLHAGQRLALRQVVDVICQDIAVAFTLMHEPRAIPAHCPFWDRRVTLAPTGCRPPPAADSRAATAGAVRVHEGHDRRRHSFASDALMGGVPLAIIGEMLGAL